MALAALLCGASMLKFVCIDAGVHPFVDNLLFNMLHTHTCSAQTILHNIFSTSEIALWPCILYKLDRASNCMTCLIPCIRLVNHRVCELVNKISINLLQCNFLVHFQLRKFNIHNCTCKINQERLICNTENCFSKWKKKWIEKIWC